MQKAIELTREGDMMVSLQAAEVRVQALLDDSRYVMIDCGARKRA